MLAAAERLEDVGGALRAGGRADHEAPGRRADQGPARLALRPGRASDPQGQAGQADRVRLRRATGRGDAEHEAGHARLPAPAATPRATPASTSCCRTRSPSCTRLGLSPREVALDGGFQTKASAEALAPLAPERISSPDAPHQARNGHSRRLARYRVGAEGRISHLKRRHGLRRSRLKGADGRTNLDRLGDVRLQRRNIRQARLNKKPQGRTGQRGGSDPGQPRPRISPARSSAEAFIRGK